MFSVSHLHKTRKSFEIRQHFDDIHNWHVTSARFVYPLFLFLSLVLEHPDPRRTGVFQQDLFMAHSGRRMIISTG